MIPFGIEKHLRLLLEPSEAIGVDNAVAVTLEIGTNRTLFLETQSTAAFLGMGSLGD